jgi:hypothetical protein
MRNKAVPKREWHLFAGMMSVACLVFMAQAMPSPDKEKTVLLEVVRNSWSAERSETLVYLRVYSDGLAEAHLMRRVDFRDIHLAAKKLSNSEVEALKHLLFEPATMQLQAKYLDYWGGKDFGYKYSVTIYDKSMKDLELVNFQPFLARQNRKPYPKQLEKLGCEIWKLRTEVTGEPLEKDWLKGCAELGY